MVKIPHAWGLWACRERGYAVETLSGGLEVIVSGNAGRGSSGMGWLVWIGVIVGVNVLSYAFDWGFWLY